MKSRRNRKPRPLNRAIALAASAAGLVAGIAAFTANLSGIQQWLIKQFGPDDVQLIVGLATEPYKYSGDDGLSEDDHYQVSYQSDLQGDTLKISYISEHSHEKAKPVGILGAGPYFALPKVGIDIKVVNNSNKAIFLSDMDIEVFSSRPDNQPLMAFTHNAGVTDEIEFTNDGWGDPRRIQLIARLKIDSAKQFQELPGRVLQTEWDGQKMSTYRFDITPLLAPHGIPVDKIKRLLSQEEMSQEEQAENHNDLWAEVQIPCVRGIGTLTYFPGDDGYSESRKSPADYSDEELSEFPYNCIVEVEGYLVVTWTDENDIEHSSRTNFETEVYVTPAEGLGAPAFDPTGTYDVALRRAGKNYTISKPISQPIEAGKFDRFIIWLGAPQSSAHEFFIRINFNNTEEILSQRINLAYLMPLSNREILDSAEKGE